MDDFFDFNTSRSSGGVGIGPVKGTHSRGPNTNNNSHAQNNKKYKDPQHHGAYTQEYHAAFAHSGWIKIARLHRSLSEGDVATVFSQFGEVADVRFAVREHDGQPTAGGYAFLEFIHPQAAVIACDCMNSAPYQYQQNSNSHYQNSSNNININGTVATTNLIPAGAAAAAAAALVSSAAAPSSIQSSSAPPPAFQCRLAAEEYATTTTSTSSTSGTRFSTGGLIVDHCEAHEVPALPEGCEGYGHWISRLVEQQHEQ